MESSEVIEVRPGRFLSLIRGDITTLAVDAIVNAANQRMLGGGGVDGAIHMAAGHELHDACLAIPEIADQIRCRPGDARITPGFRLRARYVIHTVGPRYESAAQSAPVLRQAHDACLRLADEYRLESLAFPAISCGIFGYPLEEAATIALTAVRDWPGQVSDVRFVLLEERTFRAWRRRLIDEPAHWHRW
jgi:O-acetyl-ADP-ribose deacetylase (regulator of RNase III)